MATLRIDAHHAGEEVRARIAFAADDGSRAAEVVFPFAWSAQDEEDLRWYLEDYPSYTADPGPHVAARIEERLATLGRALFERLFRRPETADLWTVASEHLGDLRVEVACESPALVALPWELMRDSASDTRLTLSTRAFVRVHPHPARKALIPPHQDRVRILLVICRPRGAEDVPFRTVASRLLSGLALHARSNIRVDVLRPPTFERLAGELRQARLTGDPYQVVHFDGHGAAGGLEFERPDREGNAEVIDGSRIGRLLADNRVPVLVLNACRSAYAQTSAEPIAVVQDPHHHIRSFGSLAHAVADQGVPGIVAMRFNVFVETAARFMLDLYAALATGLTIGEATNAAREILSADPLRDTIPTQVPLEDWLVPMTFEAQDLRLVPTTSRGEAHGSPRIARGGDQIDPEMPRRPDTGFLGRDETLWALDRAFDASRVVLLQAYAGSGKTATAAEFARWYSQTGGIAGQVLFTSFAVYRTLAQVVDHVGQRFQRELTEQGIHWPTIQDAAERRRVALDVLAHHEVLWIWDNVEPIAGFPAGTPSRWDEREQHDLANFLRDASDRGTKVLLTSRRDERAWLGDLPTLVKLPPMPFRERLQLTRALAAKLGRSIGDVEDWRPLLEFTQGNPLTITNTVAQALRDQLRTPAQIDAFVARLRTGMANIRDEIEEGRSRSLAASLSYGMEKAFTDRQRRIVALLSLFQGFVNADVFRLIGGGERILPELKDVGERELLDVFDIASELGLMERVTAGMYRIHPAVPWFLREQFDNLFEGRERECVMGFCMAQAITATHLSQEFQRGNTAVATFLVLEDANLLHGWRLALRWELWEAFGFILHGMEETYFVQGRSSEWRVIVAKSLEVLVDPTTGEARPGFEAAWAIAIEQDMRLARDDFRLEAAEVSVRKLIDYYRSLAAPYLNGEAPFAEGAQVIHNLSVMLESLGGIQVRLGKSAGVAPITEALHLAERIGAHVQAAIACRNLGNAYTTLADIEDLDQAYFWYVEALKRGNQHDGQFVGKTLLAIALLHYERARRATHDSEEATTQVKQAGVAFTHALGVLPEYAVGERAEAYLNRGVMFLEAGASADAEKDLRDALALAQRGDLPRFVACALVNLSVALYDQHRDADALTYGNAAMQMIETLGDQEDFDAAKLTELVAEVRKRLADEGASQA